MRVLVVSPFAFPHVGGLESLVDQEIRMLAKAGHSIVLVTSDAGGDVPCPTYGPLVCVERIPAWHFLERYLYIFYPLFSPRLLPVLWRQVGRSDMVHVHGFLFLCSVLALLIGRLRCRPCLLTEHLGTHPSYSLGLMALAGFAVETVGRLSARMATRLFAYNPSIVRTLNRLAHSEDKAVLLVKPIDTSVFTPPRPGERVAMRRLLGWETDRWKVLFVGRLIPDKGVHLLLRATDAAYDIAFCGAGDPAILGPLPRPGVEYFPARSHRELIAIYHAADLLVLPSIREGGLPMVALEGLACGLSCVLSHYPGSEVYHDVPGLRFCEPDPCSIRRTLLAELRAGVAPAPPTPRGCRMSPFLPPEKWISTLYESVEPSVR